MYLLFYKEAKGHGWMRFLRIPFLSYIIAILVVLGIGFPGSLILCERCVENVIKYGEKWDGEN